MDKGRGKDWDGIFDLLFEEAKALQGKPIKDSRSAISYAIPARINYWIIKDGKPTVTNDLHEWNRFLRDIKARTVAKHCFEFSDHKIEVSTVFLGLDHGFIPNSFPVLYETMIFGGGKALDQSMWRYHTAKEARKGHADAMRLVRKKTAS